MLPGHNSQKAATVVAAATGVQTSIKFNLGPKQGAIVQVKFGTTGTLRIQGRLSPEAPLVDLTADIVHGSGVNQIVVLTNACPEMAVNVTANGSTVDVWIMA